MTRREFFKVAAICGAVSTLPGATQTKPVASQENSSMHQIPLTSSAGTRKGDMLYRKPGRTGEEVSAIGLGGFHLGQHGLTEDASIRLIGKYELFKTSSHFDSTAKHPDWLGGNTPSVQSLAPAS